MLEKMSTSKNLILITNHFPYGTGESFLRNEIDYLIDPFDKVVVLTRNIQAEGDPVVKINFLLERINPKSNVSEIVQTALLSLLHFKKIKSIILSELRDLRSRKKRMTFKKFRILVHDLFKALALSRVIKKSIQRNQLNGTVIIYSYWLTSAALAAAFVKSKNRDIKRVSRAHGSDVYEATQPEGYRSFREALAEHLDGIFTVSLHGLNHLKNCIDVKWHSKLHLSRLGTRKPESFGSIQKSEAMLIVSCSNLNTLKRVHLIIEALSLLAINVQWIHFGDGPLRSELEKLAVHKFSTKQNIKSLFRGAISNEDILQFYSKNYVDLFINTSSSEGIPVSIMEAQSFGIPAVAMNVGGVSEIVNPETGILLNSEDPPEQIAKAITELLNLPEETKSKLRKNVFEQWEGIFNADRNFPAFIKQLLNL